MGETKFNTFIVHKYYKIWWYFYCCFDITEPDNRATAGVSADASFQDAILPYAKTIEEHLDGEVVDHYEPGFTCQLSDTEPRGEEAEAQTAINVFQSGISRCNESRAMVGLPPVEGDVGEAFFDNKSSESMTHKEELKEGYKNSNHDNLEAIAAQQLSLELD
ncbi:hypothetical protein IQ265_09480 [Nodosilinea sp. LEGE 06152]|uniref:hypothetical protein n=1 Tax=Nodosilinea sp. LEGE 06152 TaxID=2777966 RepID=UPI001880C204|nr:hypothetical protein [Nodosilinea sp. LEGE 06152]MBE9157054.1 hypothetical protein [Nodosilinea sp. LEGE 06152]